LAPADEDLVQEIPIMANVEEVVAFARSPAGLSEELLDYRKPEDCRIYKAATTPLDVKFDGEGAGLLLFLEMIRERAEESNWGNIIMIPDSKGDLRNLLSEYGRLSLENVRTYALTYVGQEGRKEQNSAQMYACLAKSLTEAAKVKILSQSAQYRIGQNHLPDGPSFLRLLIQRCTTDSRATVATIRNSLGNLPVFMTSIEGNVEKFNQHVRMLRDSLLQRGQDSDDLLVNLFKSYKVVPNQDFRDYIKMQNNFYIDGDKDFEVEELMEVAANKYKELVEDGTWSTSATAEAQFVALTAEIAALKAAATPAKGEAKPKNRKKQKKGNKGNAWKKVPPKGNAPTTKKVDKKTYHWCPHHAYWCFHLASDCYKKNDAPKNVNANSKASSKALQLSAAITSIMEDDSE
jgi:hypothetical protein